MYPKPTDYPVYKPEDDANDILGGRRCIAWARQSGRRCKQPAMWGRDVCRFHGGKSYRGIASPRMTHGQYCKDILSRIVGLHGVINGTWGIRDIEK